MSAEKAECPFYRIKGESMNKHIWIILVLMAIIFTSAFQATDGLINISDQYFSDGTVTVFFNETGKQLDFSKVDLLLNNVSMENVNSSPMNSNSIPMTTLFLVDTSANSYYSRYDRAQAVIDTFVKNTSFSNRSNCQLFVIPFGDQIGAVYDPESDPNSLTFEDKSSDYFAAVKNGIDFLKQRRESGNLEKQQIVLITDAEKSSELSISQTQLRQKLDEADIPIYALISLNPLGIVDDDVFNKVSILAEASGGKAFRMGEKIREDTLAEETIMLIGNSYAVTGAVPAYFTVSPDDSYQLALQLYRGDSLIAIEAKDVSLPGVYERGMVAAASATEVSVYAAQTAEARAASVEMAATQTAEAEARKIQTAEAEIVATQTAVASFEQVGCTVGDTKCLEQSGFERFLSRTTIIKSVKNLYLLIILVVLILALILFFIFHSKKKKECAKDEEKPAEVPSIEITFENADRSKSEAPIQQRLKPGEEKVFGRVTKGSVIGLNGDRSISMTHFKLSFEDGIVFIEDMASSNGVFLNGTRIQTRSRVRDNDLILLGQVTYRFHIKWTETVEEPRKDEKREK